MKYKIIEYTLEGVPDNYIIMHPKTAEENSLAPGNLLVCEDENYGFRVLTSAHIKNGLAGLHPDKMEEYNIEAGSEINLIPGGIEGVTRIIRRKMNKRTLSATEIETFISAIDADILTSAHIAAFGTAVEINGMHEQEITSVAQSIINHSKKLKPKGKFIVDKHSIGGIAGNRITPLIIPIVSAAGLTIPKVSTRAITSPAGTVDALETIMNTNLTFEEAADVLNKTNACMVNGETVGLGQVADKFLSTVKQVKIDPREMMIASILAKKKAAGAEYVIIDLPTGKGSKLPTRADARRLAYDFSSIGDKIGLRVDAVVSPGDKPIGRMIGPSLEMKEVLRILEGKTASMSLKRKALSLSGLIFEAVGYASRGLGYATAEDILNSGKALDKLKEIIEAQGGSPEITSDKIPEAPYKHIITAEKDDIVYSIDSYNVGLMARSAGAPTDHYAGVILHVSRGQSIRKGDPIIEIHSHSEAKIDEAIAIMKTAQPIALEEAILEFIAGVNDDNDDDKYSD